MTAAADRGLASRLQRELGEIRALQESLQQMVEELKDRIGSTGERMQASQNYLYRELSQEIEEIREQLSLSTQAISPCTEGEEKERKEREIQESGVINSD